MPQYDYLLAVHGKAVPTTGVAWGQGGTEVSADELDFGRSDPNPGAANNFGLHVEIMQSYATITSAIIAIIHGSTTAPTTVAVERYFPVAELAAGKHYFIPAPPTLRRYVKAKITPSTTATAGMVLAWFGPGKDGAQ